jgi:hypothetical protein
MIRDRGRELRAPTLHYAGIIKRRGWYLGLHDTHFRGVAQLVARTAGGREVAGSSPVTPTMSGVSR